MTNIPAGYNEDGEYVGYGYMPEEKQRFVKVPKQSIKGEVKKLIKSKEVKLIEPKEVARLYEKS